MRSIDCTVLTVIAHIPRSSRCLPKFLNAVDFVDNIQIYILYNIINTLQLFIAM